MKEWGREKPWAEAERGGEMEEKVGMASEERGSNGIEKDGSEGILLHALGGGGDRRHRQSAACGDHVAKTSRDHISEHQ